MDRRLSKNKYVHSSSTEAFKYENDVNENSKTERYNNNKTSVKNVCTNRKVEYQISSEAFKSFIDKFFVDIDHNLFDFATTEYKISKALRHKGSGKNLSKICRLKILKKKIKYAIIFGVTSQTVQTNNESVHINKIGKDILNAFITDTESISDENPLEIFPDVKNVFMKQVEVNNSRRRILTTAIRDRLQSYAYFHALNILENDIETIFVSRVRNKRHKKNKDAGCNELRTIMERIQLFKNTYGNVEDHTKNLTNFEDLFNASENLDITRFGFQNEPYFD